MTVVKRGKSKNDNVGTGIRSMWVVYNEAIRSCAGQAWAFELPIASMRRLAYLNDPHASNSFVYRLSNDHTLKVAAKGV